MKMQDKKQDLQALLGEVTALDRGLCRQAWFQAFKTYPPKYLSSPFMQRVLAHDLQCRTLGGYSAATRRALKLVLGGKDLREVLQAVGDGVTPVREWNGRVYRVEARTEGYVLDGRTYTSLSAVARHITGARWSGPRFFGLTSKRSV